MAYRQKMKKSRSKRVFRNGVIRKHKKNRITNVQRGGIAL